MKKIFMLLALVLCLCGCQKTEYPVSKTDFVLNTVSTIDIYAYDGNDDPEELINDCFSYIRELENTLSRTVKGSDIYILNNAEGEAVTVSDCTKEVIEKGILYGEITDGAFDISIAPVSSLWDFQSEEKIIPDEDEISLGIQKVDYKNIVVDGNSVTLLNGAQLDLGAIAKGYIADKAAEFLRERNVTSGIVNLGGNNIVIGKNGDRAFRIGIQTPTATTGVFSGVLNLEDMSAVTSGAYQRYFEKDGKIYHHILNPSTGYPAESDIASVTIICASSTDADALSTSCFILGTEKAVELLDSLDYASGVIITKSGETVLTDGAEEFFEEIK